MEDKNIFRVESNHYDDNRCIVFEYNKNGKIEKRKLYVRKLTASLIARLVRIQDKIEELKNNESINEKDKVLTIFDLFLQFLQLSIVNFDENKDLIDDLPFDNDFMQKFTEKIQEKLMYSNANEKELKKKTSISQKKKSK